MSSPIRELRVNMLNPIYFGRAQQYLEQEVGCTFTNLGDNTYLVLFPPGTVEEDAPDTSGRPFKNTIIKLPNSKTLTKRVYPPKNPDEKLLVSLLFPPGVLEEKKEATHPRRRYV